MMRVSMLRSRARACLWRCQWPNQSPSLEFHVYRGHTDRSNGHPVAFNATTVRYERPCDDTNDLATTIQGLEDRFRLLSAASRAFGEATSLLDAIAREFSVVAKDGPWFAATA